MKVVRPTNLGYLTLKSLRGLDEKYGENANLKRKKLAKLWRPNYSMELFLGMFPEGTIILPIVLGGNEPEFRLKVLDSFEKMGLVYFQDEEGSLRDVVTRSYLPQKRNPLINLEGLTLELTGLCNLKCKHCYRGGSRPNEYGLSVEAIKTALDPLLRAGIRNITITGGEPTLRKDDLFEIIDYASQFLELKGVSLEEKMFYEYGKTNPNIDDILKTEYYTKLRKKLIAQLLLPEERLIPGDYRFFNENTPEDVERFLRERAKIDLDYKRKPSFKFSLDSVGVLSNGYFEEKEQFLKTLQSYGNVTLQVSLDSFNGHVTNKNRGVRGVFGSVKNLVGISKPLDYPIYITGHDMGRTNTPSEGRNSRYFDSNSRLIVLPEMLQIGNSVPSKFSLEKSNKRFARIGDLSSLNEAKRGWCTGWTKPRDIHIKPTGVVGNCLYAYAVPEEFGNLNSEQMENILNGIQDTRVYQMFLDGTIERSQHELDKSIFGRKYHGPCELIALTLTYATFKERFLREGAKDPIKAANQEVAKIYKFRV